MATYDRRGTLRELIRWAMQRREAEVEHRPEENIHKRTLQRTWDQVIDHLQKLLDEEW